MFAYNNIELLIFYDERTKTFFPHFEFLLSTHFYVISKNLPFWPPTELCLHKNKREKNCFHMCLFLSLKFIWYCRKIKLANTSWHIIFVRILRSYWLQWQAVHHFGNEKNLVFCFSSWKCQPRNVNKKEVENKHLF